MEDSKKAVKTKKKFVKALKQKMEEKPFSKISVSELVETCGVNRKTFYYHFSDTGALLKWMFEHEALDVMKGFNCLNDYDSALLFGIDYVEKNKHILSCVYDSLGREELKKFFFSDLESILLLVIDSIRQPLNIELDDDFLDFLLSFYTEALFGIIIDYFHDQTLRNRSTLASYITLIFKTSLPNIIKEKAGYVEL